MSGGSESDPLKRPVSLDVQPYSERFHMGVVSGCLDTLRHGEHMGKHRIPSDNLIELFRAERLYFPVPVTVL